jgi:hypothetical protein
MWDGKKPYEVRKFDRNFAVGDILRLFEYYPPPAENFTGRYMRVYVKYITAPGSFGLPDNIGVLSLQPLEQRQIDPFRARTWCSVLSEGVGS